MPLPIRNRRFDLSNVPRHWHGGRRSVTAFFDGLSIFFPEGERFFIRSVRHHADRVKDEELQKDIRGFCGQEGVHGREHDRYNAMLEEQGYPAKQMERRVTGILDLVTKITPKRFQLAATCALEHFTALMGHMILEHPENLDGADPTMAALWRWHAAEENEHKALAFDVYEAAGGNEAERAVVMFVATIIFWAKVAEHQARMMHADGIVFDAREWKDLIRFLFIEPGSMTKLIPLYLRYYKRGFHPRDIDTRQLLEDWLASDDRLAA